MPILHRDGLMFDVLGDEAWTQSKEWSVVCPPFNLTDVGWFSVAIASLWIYCPITSKLLLLCVVVLVLVAVVSLLVVR